MYCDGVVKNTFYMWQDVIACPFAKLMLGVRFILCSDFYLKGTNV